MTKRLAIIGRGTAGCFAASHFAARTDFEIDLYYDPNFKPQTVGESGNLDFPRALWRNVGINYSNLNDIDGTYKIGVTKLNWTKGGQSFTNNFPPGSISYHFNAYKLQNLILERLSNRINIIERRINRQEEDIDSDYIMDCSGKPTLYSEFNYLSSKDDSIPVNATYVVECFCDHVKYNTTHAIARPYGWAFAVPLTDRVSVGYMYNRFINTLDEVKKDINEVFKQLELIPSDKQQAFDFDNYHRKQNFTDRVAYNGNQSFFLEPLEATSVWAMDFVQNTAEDIWINGKSVEEANKLYNLTVKRIETCIMLHYLGGSTFDTDFWKYATERAEKHIGRALRDPEFLNILKLANTVDLRNPTAEYLDTRYGIWIAPIWNMHMKAWNLYPKLAKLFKPI